jgi:transposase
MSQYHPHNFEIPEETRQVASAAFPKGNVYLRIRDEFGPLFKDEDFGELYSYLGQGGESPAILAQVTVMQYMEGLTDRQAAEAVRSRIDWKYSLGLPLTAAGFHHSILGDFRDRLLEGGKEALLFDQVLERLKAAGLLKGKRQQRTDSTHVIAAIRTLQRVEVVGEGLRRVLDDIAKMAPEWLLQQVTSDWFDRYGARIEMYRLPQAKSELAELQLQIGRDGFSLLEAIYSSEAPSWLREIPSVEIMGQIWEQQYYRENGEVKWRDKKKLPPFKELIVSPDDVEARNRTKRKTNWSGYAVHLTETHAENAPNIITNVETTPATTADAEMTGVIHQSLADKDLLPDEHLVDTAYVSVDHLLESQRDQNIDLIGPVGGGGSWQAKADKGFDVSFFVVDWEKQTLTCPKGKVSQNWHLRREKYGHDYFEIRFNPADCQVCSHRSDCTRSKRGVRTVCLRPQAEYETLKAARERQKTKAFKETYKKRAGIEGTISQGTRSFDLRRARYIGLAKTRLQHLAVGAAMNLTRAVAWLMQDQPKTTSIRQTPFLAISPVT